MYFKLLLSILSMLPPPAGAQVDRGGFPSRSPNPTYFDPTASPYPTPSPSNFPTGALPTTPRPSEPPNAPGTVSPFPTFFVPTESPYPSPAPSVTGCEVCGPGSRVTIPDAIFSKPGKPVTTCADLERVGLSGVIPEGDFCDSLAAELTMCGCAVPTAAPAALTSAPTALTATPAALTPAPIALTSAPTAPTFSCNICTGSSRGGQSVSLPDTMVTLPGQTPMRCGELFDGGLSGTISEADCLTVPSKIDVCGCGTDGSPTVMPSVSPSNMPVTPSSIDAPFAMLPPNVGPDISFGNSAYPSYAPVMGPTDETPDPTPTSPVRSPVLPVVTPIAPPIVAPVFEPPAGDDNVQIQGPPAETNANLSGGAIFGIILASVVGTGLLLLGCYWIYRELSIRSTHTTGEVVDTSPTSNNKGPPQTMFENMAPQASLVEGTESVGAAADGGTGVGNNGPADGEESSISQAEIL